MGIEDRARGENWTPPSHCGAIQHAIKKIQQQQQNNNMAAVLVDTVKKLDEILGLDDYTNRQITFLSVLILTAILLTLHEKGGIRWHSLIHAVVSGYLSFICVWMSFHHNSTTATTLCDGPLTSLHRITPSITLGYGIFDILEVMTKSLSSDFLLHGVATFGVIAYFCEYNIPEIVLPFLLMEISTGKLFYLPSQIIYMLAHLTSLGISSL